MTTSICDVAESLTTALARNESISLDMTSIKDLFVSLTQDIDELRDDCCTKFTLIEKLKKECKAKADYIATINKQLDDMAQNPVNIIIKSTVILINRLSPSKALLITNYGQY